MILRDYQTKAVNDVTQACGRGARRVILQLPTGSGKTIIAANIIQHAVKGGYHALFLTHRREILFQTCDKLKAFGVEAAVMLSGDPHDRTLPCVVASVPTMHSWCVKRHKEPIPKADVVFFDEAHHVAAKTFVDLAQLYPDAYIIGLTATPITKTGKGLAAHFDRLIQGPAIKDLIAQGHLVQPRYIVPSLPDLKGLHIRQGDYVEGELENRFDKPELVGDIAQNWIRFGEGRKTLVYGITVKHSQHIAARFNELGIAAKHIDGKTEKSCRDEAVKELREGNLKVISSVGVFTEGVDIPAASCIVNARPTKSLGLWCQILGRGLRPFPGKESCLILDHSGATYEHGRVEEPIAWSLEYNKKFSKIRDSLRKKRERKTIVCESCKTLYEPSIKGVDCPNCGRKLEIKGKPVETIEAWLKYLNEEDPQEISQKEWYIGLRNIARLKGWKEGWAAHKYREHFGKWPFGGWKQDANSEIHPQVSAWWKAQMDRYWIIQRARENRTRAWKTGRVPQADLPLLGA